MSALFKTWQDRLPKELVLEGINSMAETNRFIKEVFLPRFNKVFKQAAGESGSAFVPMLNVPIKDIYVCRKSAL